MVTPQKVKYYVKPIEGVFSLYTKDLETYQTTASSIAGVFESVSIVHDEGTPAVKGKSFAVTPYDALVVFMYDPETNESYSLKANLDRTFTRTLAAQLQGIEKGDRVKLVVKPGDNAKVTLVTTYKWNGSDFEYQKFSGWQSADKTAEAKEAILKHPAYREFEKPKEA
jgi:hypothetical protein